MMLPTPGLVVVECCSRTACVPRHGLNFCTHTVCVSVLTTFCITLSVCGTAMSAQAVMQSLAQLTALTSLYINCRFPHLTVGNFATTLARLTNLSSINIYSLNFNDEPSIEGWPQLRRRGACLSAVVFLLNITRMPLVRALHQPNSCAPARPSCRHKTHTWHQHRLCAPSPACLALRA